MSSRVAVIMATVHRPDDVVTALETVLRSTYSSYEIIVVDQSDDQTSRERVGSFLDDPRIRYIQHQDGGLSAALNRGAELSDAEILAITGDDCSVREDWLERMVAAFDADPQAGVLFGNVVPGRYERDDGFVPGCILSEAARIGALEDIHRLSGTTANMGLRRSLWQELHGFDEALGVGAPLRSAEDLDLSLRALAAGHFVLQDPEVETTHRSPTLWIDRSTTIRRNWFGSGAAFAKALKRFRLPMLRALLRLSRRWVSGGSEVAATYGPKPDRVSMLIGFGHGFMVGLARRVDSATGHFRGA